MRRRPLFMVSLLLLPALVASITYAQWRLRATTAIETITPRALTGLEFKTLIGEDRWMPIAPKDAPGIVSAFNADRSRLVELMTPVFSARGNLALASAPSYLLHYDDHVEEWTSLTRKDPLTAKYVALSLDSEVASNEPTIVATQVKMADSVFVDVVVTDPHVRQPTIVVLARRSRSDTALAIKRFDEGKPVTLTAEGPPGRYHGIFLGKATHAGRVVVEYTYDHFPDSSNDYTRMVSCQVGLYYH